MPGINPIHEQPDFSMKNKIFNSESSAYQGKQNRNYRKNQQDMDKPTGRINKETEQPTNNQDNCDDI
jgi:hypothetical protein